MINGSCTTYIEQERQTGRLLGEAREAVGGRLLSFDAGPASAYLARWPLGLRYHVGHPLYWIREFRFSRDWARIADILRSGECHVIVYWPSWFDLDRPERAGLLANVAEYHEAMALIRANYVHVADLEPGHYSGPMCVLADHASAERVRAIMAALSPGAGEVP